MMFFQAEEGGLHLNHDETNRYLNCLDALLSSREVLDQYSRDSVSRFMQTVILSALDLRKRRQEKVFGIRLAQALDALRSVLEAPPRSWSVFMPVDGLAPDALPQRFGNVEFCAVDDPRLRQPFQTLVDTPDQGADRNGGWVRALVSGIDDRLADLPVALAEVQAGDSETALCLARRNLRLALDVLNFYADLLYPPRFRVAVRPAEERPPRLALSVVADRGRSEASVPHETVGPLRPLSFEDVRSSTYRELGIERAGQLLANRKGSDLDELLLSALQWAGRATVEPRPEVAFLHYAIALESIMLGPDPTPELSYRLRMRTAWVLGNEVKKRKGIADAVGRLYAIRSSIVHSGRCEVAESDVQLMRSLAKTSIVAILTRSPFAEMQRYRELNTWFHEAMLGASF